MFPWSGGFNCRRSPLDLPLPLPTMHLLLMTTEKPKCGAPYQSLSSPAFQEEQSWKRMGACWPLSGRVGWYCGKLDCVGEVSVNCTSSPFLLRCRLCFRQMQKAETDKERLLTVYYINQDLVEGRFPITSELSLELAALMAQVRSLPRVRVAP